MDRRTGSNRQTERQTDGLSDRETERQIGGGGGGSHFDVWRRIRYMDWHKTHHNLDGQVISVGLISHEKSINFRSLLLLNE